MHGGKVIGKGGYGLVNHPAILCNKDRPQINGKTINRNDYVSKATIMMEALTEYVVAEIIKSNIENIDTQNKKYFVLPISEPCPVTYRTTIADDDIKSKYNYDTRFFEQAWLSHLPYGGLNGKSYVQEQCKTAKDSNNMLIWYNALDTIKTNLLNAFEKGLLPLNKKGIFHGDLKLENILIDNNNNVRFTDWGISKVPLEMVDNVELSDRLIVKLKWFFKMHENKLETKNTKTPDDIETLNNIKELLGADLKKEAREQVKKSMNRSCVGENTPLRKELFESPEQKKGGTVLEKVINTLQIALAYKPDNLYKEIEERKEKEKEDEEFDIWGLVMIFGEILRRYHSRLLLDTRIQISKAIIALYKHSPNTDKILDALKKIQFTSGPEDVIKKEDLDVINSVFLKNFETRIGTDALEIIKDFNNTCTNYSLHLECKDINHLDTLHLILKEGESEKIRYEIDYPYYQSSYGDVFSNNFIQVSCIDGDETFYYDDFLISVIVLVVPSLFKGVSNTITFNHVDDNFEQALKKLQENGLEKLDSDTYRITINEKSIEKATELFETNKTRLCPAAVPIAAPPTGTAAPPTNPPIGAALPTGGKRRTTKRKTRRSRRRKSSHRKSNRHRRHSRRRNVRTRR